MKRAILTVAFTAYATFASADTGNSKIVLEPILINGHVVYVQVEVPTSAPQVTKSNQPGLVTLASKKPRKPGTAAGLRRSLLRSNFR